MALKPILIILAIAVFEGALASVEKDGTIFDFIIVGGGTAGSVLAERLSNNPNVRVLVIEAGGYAPIEADDFPGLFPALARSPYDYDFIAQNDYRTAQNLQNLSISLTAGKMLGGSSSLHHLMHIRGFPEDYNEWARIVNDEAWNYENIKPYFDRIEKLTDEDLIESPYFSDFFGINGTLGLTRDANPTNNKYLDAFKELGYNINNVTTNLGYSEVLFYIENGIRQSTSLAYLGNAKSRPNLCVSLFTTATKILIENGVAVGVQATISNSTYVWFASKEVIVCAGTVNSPKLLMLSGIGPRSHLESKGIDVVVDLPGVGRNFQDPPSVTVVYQMEESSAPPIPSNPHTFGVPVFVGLVALNSSQKYPDYLSFNFEFQHDSTNLLTLCGTVLKYSNEVCQKFYEANKGRTILLVINDFLIPKSRGRVLLGSADPKDAPLIYPGTYSKKTDLKLMAQSLQDYNKIISSTYFRSVNASIVNLGFCSNTCNEDDFWECYALKMSNTIWHYCGTCAMGSVLDSNLRVKGVERLRVADASAMPELIRGKIHAIVVVIAERAADLIISTWGIRN